jgi:hypothetical protein
VEPTVTPIPCARLVAPGVRRSAVFVAEDALVPLPGWFAALNRDFRYQLTPLGKPAPDLHAAPICTRTCMARSRSRATPGPLSRKSCVVGKGPSPEA